MQAMLADVDANYRANGVILPEPGYDPVRQLPRNNWPLLLNQLWFVPAAALVVPVPLAWGLRRAWRRWHRVG